MFNLTEPFVMPEKIMLRTQQGNVTAVGSCHMAVPQAETMVRTAIGSCHMAVPQPEAMVRTAIGSCHMAVPQSEDNDSTRRQYRGASMHREVVVLG